MSPLFLNAFLNFLESPVLLFLSLTSAIILRIVLLIILNGKFSGLKTASRSATFLSLTLIFSLIVDILSTIKLLHASDFLSLDGTELLIIKRLHWAINICFHLCLSLFAESLIAKSLRINPIYGVARTIVGTLLAATFIVMIVLPLAIQHQIGAELRQLAYFFNLAIGFCTIFTILRTTKKSSLPKVLKYQLKIFIAAFMAPQLFFKCLTYNPFTDGRMFCTNLVINISIILLTAAMYYCTFKLMGLRFLNTREHVTASRKFNFVRLMKDVISQLNSVANSAEFRHVTQQVFSKAFSLPDQSVRLILMEDKNYLVNDDQVRLLETSLRLDQPLAQLLERTKVITRDEIDFSAYYDQNPAYTQAADFLQRLGADVFIPIYDRQTFLGCIIVNTGVRANTFYSGKEQDEMALFAGSLSAIITAVRNRNIDVLLARKNTVEAELYHRDRELSQYQESIRSFLHTSYENQVGILYYKYGTFTFGNQSAHEFVTGDPNYQHGHPLTIQLRKIAQNTEKYGTSQHATICIDAEQRLTISAFTSLEKQSTVLVVSRPSIADIIKLQSDVLRDPSEWNYLLYLETTEVGRRVRGFIPGSGKTLLNFKIDLMRATLSQRAVLINSKSEDRQQIVDLLHTTSNKKELQTITLKEPEKELAVGRKLFGLAKVLGAPQESAPLLERLDKTGTIYIENVHFLSRETQSYLADFLRYGAYTAIRGDQRIPADVRILCSSTESLPELVKEGHFLPELLDEIYSHNLALAQPSKLDQKEFDELVHEYMHELLKNHPLKKILALSEREITGLFAEKYATFAELKRRLNALISAKTMERGKHLPASASSPAQNDEQINRALLLGKKALHDPELMKYLWETFQNQSRIATLLGVNRSSVNRRFKLFQIN